MTRQVLYGFHAVTVRLKTAPDSIVEVRGFNENIVRVGLHRLHRREVAASARRGVADGAEERAPQRAEAEGPDEDPQEAREGRQDEEPRILERLRRGERVDHYETVRRRKDGSPVEISLTISPVRNQHGRIIGDDPAQGIEVLLPRR